MADPYDADYVNPNKYLYWDHRESLSWRYVHSAHTDADVREYKGKWICVLLTALSGRVLMGVK